MMAHELLRSAALILGAGWSFTGSYSEDEAEVQGTALVGKTSVLFDAKLTLKASL